MADDDDDDDDGDDNNIYFSKRIQTYQSCLTVYHCLFENFNFNGDTGKMVNIAESMGKNE